MPHRRVKRRRRLIKKQRSVEKEREDYSEEGCTPRKTTLEQIPTLQSLEHPTLEHGKNVRRKERQRGSAMNWLHSPSPCIVGDMKLSPIHCEGGVETG